MAEQNAPPSLSLSKTNTPYKRKRLPGSTFSDGQGRAKNNATGCFGSEGDSEFTTRRRALEGPTRLESSIVGLPKIKSRERMLRKVGGLIFNASWQIDENANRLTASGIVALRHSEFKRTAPKSIAFLEISESAFEVQPGPPSLKATRRNQ